MRIFFPKLSNILNFSSQLKGIYAARIKTAFLQHSSIIERVGCASFFTGLKESHVNTSHVLTRAINFIFPYIAPTWNVSGQNTFLRNHVTTSYIKILATNFRSNC
jgi:hypothetical protein